MHRTGKDETRGKRPKAKDYEIPGIGGTGEGPGGKKDGYSITSSASASSVGGTVRPSALAVLRLITNSNLVGCMDRQVGRLLALENAAGIDAGLAVRFGKAGSVAHQAAGHGELAPKVDRGHRVAGRQRDDLIAPAVEERIGANDERAGPLLDHGCEGRVDVAFGAGIQDMELQPQRARRRLQVFRLRSRRSDCSG